MHILIVADGRPDYAALISSIRPFGYRLTLVSTFPCAQVASKPLALPVAYGGLAGSWSGPGR
jgi:hypothetical protein